MARRSVSLPPNLERTVRRLQATLLTTMDRDISFTETLNLALAASFSVPDLARRVTTEEWQTLLEGSDWDAEGVLAKKKREILDAISDQRSTAAEPAPQALAATQEPVTPFAVAELVEPSATPTETVEPPEPALAWDEPAFAASISDSFEIDSAQAQEPVSPFQFAAQPEVPEPLDHVVTWDQPAFPPAMSTWPETPAPASPAPMPPFNFGSLAEHLDTLPEVQETPAPFVSWEEPAAPTIVPDMIELDAQTRLQERDVLPPALDTPESPFFLVQPPVIDPDWRRPEPETAPSETRAEQPENEPTRPKSESDREVYDDLAKALEEAAAAYEQTLNSDDS